MGFIFIIWLFGNPLERSSSVMAHESGIDFNKEKMEEMKLPRKTPIHPLRNLLRVHIYSF
jgi:hypothetical protein